MEKLDDKVIQKKITKEDGSSYELDEIQNHSFFQNASSDYCFEFKYIKLIYR